MGVRRQPAGALTETEIQKQIANTARAMGCKVYRMNAGGRNGYHGAEAGTPDLLVVMDFGYVLWVEVKRPGEEPTEIQAERHRELRGMGHAVAVCRSAEDFVAAVRELK